MSTGLPEYQPPTIAVERGYQPVPQTHQAQSTNVTVVSTQPGPATLTLTETKPDNYLGLSLFTCLCCCWIIGLIALVFSLQVDSAWSSGDVAGAKRASNQAKQLSIAGIVCGSIATGIAVVLIIISVAVRAGGGDSSDDDQEE